MRLFNIFYSLLVVFSIHLCHGQQRIEILHQQALDILDPKGIVEELACGFAWLEGPLWVENGGFLLFSDIPNNKVYRYHNDKVMEYLSPSGFTGSADVAHQPGANGLLLDAEGRLVLMQQGDRRVARMITDINSPVPTFETLTDQFQGKRLNSPNDGVFDKSGNLYFTDPSYGLAGLDDDPAIELTFHGVYCLKINGNLVLLDTLRYANGIGLSHGEKELYVSQSSHVAPTWYKYAVDQPGTISERSVFFRPNVETLAHPNAPDGMAISQSGVVFASGPGGIWVFSPGGEALARIYMSKTASNCTLNANETVLYITASDCLLSIDLTGNY